MLGLYLNARNFVTNRLSREEKGATAVEYGIMVALIAVVIIFAVSTLGGTLDGLFDDVNTQIKSPTAPTTPATTS